MQRRPTDPRYPTGPQQTQLSPFEVQYTPQYDPGIQQLMAQAMMSRTERYDQSADMAAQAAAQFGQTPSVRPDEVSARVGQFQDEIRDLVSEYGGDYGMARVALSRRIAEEAASPFYKRQAQIAEFAKEEREAIQRAGGIQNVFLPYGPVSSRAYYPDAPLSDYESMVVPQDDFIGIIDDISRNIKPSLVQLGLSQTEAENIMGLIRDNQFSSLSGEQLKAVASVAYDSFVAAAPSIQYSPEDHWTRDKEQTVDIMLSRWAGLHMTGDQHGSRLINMPTQSTPGSNLPPFVESPTFGTPLEASNISKEVKESERMIENIQEVQSLNSIIETFDRFFEKYPTSTLLDLPQYSEGTEDSRRDWGEYNAYVATSDQRERWSEGEATIQDALDILGSHIYSMGERAARGLINISDRAGTNRQKMNQIGQITAEVIDLFNANSTREDVVTEEERASRSELLELIWPNREEYNFKLVRGQDGIIDFDFSDFEGTKTWNNRNQRVARRKAAEDINHILIRGEKGISNRLNKVQNEIQEFIDKHPIVEEYYQQLFRELQSSGVPDQEAVAQALTQSIETLTNTQRNRRAVHATSIQLDSTVVRRDSNTGEWAADHSARNTEEARFLKRLNTFLGHNFVPVSETTIRRRDRNRSSDMSARDFSSLVTDHPITSARVIPINGLLEVKLKDQEGIFHIDLKEAGFLPQNAIVKINEVQNFIQTGTEFKDADVTIRTPFGEVNFRYVTITDEKTNQFVPVIIGALLDEEGNPTHRINNAEEYFTQFYKTFIFNSILGK